MAKTTLSNLQTDFIIKYRAVCKDDNYRGPWRDNVEAAKFDARNHRAQAGNQNHLIKIIAQQSLAMLFDE